MGESTTMDDGIWFCWVDLKFNRQNVGKLLSLSQRPHVLQNYPSIGQTRGRQKRKEEAGKAGKAQAAGREKDGERSRNPIGLCAGFGQVRALLALPINM